MLDEELGGLVPIEQSNVLRERIGAEVIGG